MVARVSCPSQLPLCVEGGRKEKGTRPLGGNGSGDSHPRHGEPKWAGDRAQKISVMSTCIRESLAGNGISPVGMDAKTILC